jgi:outer membrane protein assembly factor BamD
MRLIGSLRSARFYLRTLVYLLVVLSVAGCGARPENLSLLSADELYSRAVENFENRKFDRAISMLDFFVVQFIGDPRAPDARMMLGEAHMEKHEYATAATHYLRLVNDFPFHPRALEARFQVCEAYHRLSPQPPLDQQYTLTALAHCESVRDNFPGTPEATTAAAYVDELRLKLARKAYNNGMHYFKRRAYESAVVYFQEVVTQYPNTAMAPTALLQLVETYTRIGYVEDANETRERLRSEYPDSPEAQGLRS